MLGIEDRSPDSRLYLGFHLPGAVLQWSSENRSSQVSRFPQQKQAALTVAGQWRTFTAFPSILMIAVVTSPAGIDQQGCHELNFDDIHIYKSQPQLSQNRAGDTLSITGMIITEEQQQTLDLDWFCVDSAGLIAHFASAGFKHIPPSVAASGEDLEVLTSFFLQLPPKSSGHELDAHLPPHCRTARYLQSFVSMARRGLFSFDIDSYLKPGICYFRVASPIQPLRISELPDTVRTILARTEFKDNSFANISTISYAVTLSL